MQCCIVYRIYPPDKNYLGTLMSFSESRLDRRYTVFGEVFRGIEAVDKIIAAAKDQADNPLEPITMTVKE